MMGFSKKLALISAASVTVFAAVPALADHAWSTHHWKKGSGELTMPVGDNVDSRWDQYLTAAIQDWNKSEVIQAVSSAGATSPRRCAPVAGRIEVCNAKYGQTGWLGIAQIWLSNGHITQGTTKLNDTYFDTAKYNTPAWRALVTCQEIGHDYGLGHQDEDSGNADLTDANGVETCMDYTSLPDANGQPNGHDYAQLTSMYSHSEAATSTAQSVQSEAAGGDAPADWGRAVAFTKDGRPRVFERTTASGRKMVTHVFWAMGEGPRSGGHDDH